MWLLWKKWCHVTLCTRLCFFYYPANVHQIWLEHTPTDSLWSGFFSKTKFAKCLVFITIHGIYLNILTSPQKDFIKVATGRQNQISQYFWLNISILILQHLCANDCWYLLLMYKHNGICLRACLSQISKTCGDFSLDELCTEQTLVAQKYIYIVGASVEKSKHSWLDLNFCGPESYWKLKVNTAPLFYSLFRPTDWRASVAYYSRTISQYFCTFWCFLSENEDPDSPAGLCFCGCDQCRTISRWFC